MNKLVSNGCKYVSRLKSQEESSISDFDEQTVDGSNHAHFSFAFVHKKNLKTSFLRGGSLLSFGFLVFFYRSEQSGCN